jgi:exodeoxyribonuclease-3
MNNSIKIASWNVNSLKVRIEQVLDFINTADIDILALQETKSTDENFPLSAFKDIGLNVSFIGQKTYNGVAIISKQPQHQVLTKLEFFNDPQKRIIAATIGDIRVINLYVPNGSSVDSDKYLYKLDWLSHVTKFIEQEQKQFPNLAIVGDFNIAPEDIDVHDTNEWIGCIHVSPKERLALKNILDKGLHDSFRKFTQSEKQYSWWDYRAQSFRRNRGLRIDLILLSNQLLNTCTESTIYKDIRKHEHPSDHAPVVATIAI